MAEPKPPKETKGSVLEKTPVKEFLVPDYSEQEKTYISNLQKRLEKAKTNRDQTFIEFDGLTFTEYWLANERGANITLEPTKNRGETDFKSGTLRTKMLAFLSSFLGLNLQPDISAFTEDEILINKLGNAMEDIIEKTQELEIDEEKQMLRQYEMLKHGYVFVEEMWDEKWEVEKQLTAGFYGQIGGVKWTTKKVKTNGSPKRTIISGLAVYLGDLTKYNSEEQPYLFTVQAMDYDEVEQIYGNWERWKYVTKTKRSFSGTSDYAMVQNAWRLLGSQQNQVEVIKYQDKPNNEFQIILNGIPMLPMGYPLSCINPSGGYTIVQQNLEPIRQDFAYGKSFIFKNKNLIAVLDQMMKLAVLKTWKSFMPPRLNLSGRVISQNVFMPAVISRGILPGQVPPIDEKEAQGVTAGEFNMIQEVIQFVDRNTAAQTFTGAKEPGGRVTATQIIELQRQARIMMGLLVLAATLLEKKLAIKRLMILLERWFDPIDEVLDTARGILKNRYRATAIERSIEGEGMGIRMVIPVEEMIPSREIIEREEWLQKKTGRPVRMILLNAKEIKQAKLTWVITINAREKRSSEMSKMMFGAMIENATALGLPLNPEYIQERFAQVWNEDATKMFLKTPAGMPEAPVMPGGAEQRPRVVAPEVRMPMPLAEPRGEALV